MGEDLEPYGLAASREDDRALAEVYAKAKVAVHEMDPGALDEWREVARNSAWKSYAERSKSTERFLQWAEEA